MNEERLQYLLERYRHAELDEEEQAELNDWYHSLQYSAADFNAWVEEEGSPKELADKLYDKFRNRTKSRIIRRIWQASAVVIAMVGATMLFRTLFLPAAKQPVALSVTSIEPGKNKAILTLADGTQIVLDDAADGKIASQQGVNITKTANGQLIYDFSAGRQGTPGDNVAINTLYTPKGGQYQVILPDGTKVWLNSDTKLNFPVVFNGNERKVTLTGEAYFEVNHMKSKPFIIATGNQAIEVLGTHFNVKGYEDEQQINTTLLEGSVRIRNQQTKAERILVPGEQSRFYRNDGAIDVRKVKVEDEIAWKNGYFLFDNQDLPAILRAISRWYDVEVEFQYTGRYERFGGTFSRSSDLTDILNNLQEIGNVHFKIDKRKIIVTK